MTGLLFLQKSFQLQPFIRKSSNQLSASSIFMIILVAIAIIGAIVLFNILHKRLLGNHDAPRFTRDNFYRFGAKSGLSKKSIDYLYKRVQGHRESNPMNIFFNYYYMLRTLKAIYNQEKVTKVTDIVQFQENVSQLIDSVDNLEKHFQTVSAVLSTRLIPERTAVFLSDLKNNFRIKMHAKQNKPRHLILEYKFADDNDDTRLHKVGRQLTLWLLNDTQGGGYAAYNVRLKRIRRLSNSTKEYYITHNWRQEIPNITRKYKRIPFTQQAQLRMQGIGLDKAHQMGGVPSMIKTMMLDISLGGCSIVVNPKYESIFAKSQRLMIKFPNPYHTAKSKSSEKKSSQNENFYEIQCRITRITVYSDQSNDGLINIHLRFESLNRNIKNSLGLFIYEFENTRFRNSRSFSI